MARYPFTHLVIKRLTRLRVERFLFVWCFRGKPVAYLLHEWRQLWQTRMLPSKAARLLSAQPEPLLIVEKS